MTTDENHAVGDHKASGERIAGIAIYVILSIGLAKSVPTLVKMGIGPEALAPSLFVLLAWSAKQWKETVELWSETKSYVYGERDEFYLKNLLALAAPVSLLFVTWSTAIAAINDTPSKKSEVDYELVEQIVERLAGNQRHESFLYVMGSGSDMPRAYLHNVIFPIQFRNASLVALPDSLSVGSNPEWVPGPDGGIELSGVQSGRLDTLVDALAPCTRSTDSPVLLEVTGFASSLNFAGYDDKISDELNLRAANSRVESVRNEICRLANSSTELRNLIPENLFVNPVQHPNHDAMADHRHYNDLPAGALQGNGSESLNRSVTIHVHSAGACSTDIILDNLNIEPEWSCVTEVTPTE